MSLIDVETGEVIQEATLEDLEEIIGRGLGSFLEVGEALALVRDAKLYLKHAATFEAYCKERWGFVASRARQLIGAAQVANALAGVTNVTVANEGQARALNPLRDDPDAMADALDEATQASGGTPTAASIADAVAARVTDVSPVPKAKHAKDWVAPQESEADRTERERVEGVMRSVKRLQVLCSNWVEITHRGTPEQFVERLNLLDRFDRQRIEEIVAIYERGTADA